MIDTPDAFERARLIVASLRPLRQQQLDSESAPVNARRGPQVGDGRLGASNPIHGVCSREPHHRVIVGFVAGFLQRNEGVGARLQSCREIELLGFFAGALGKTVIQGPIGMGPGLATAGDANTDKRSAASRAMAWNSA